MSRPVIFALLLLGSTALSAVAQAKPPTVTPTPGYDARLNEQRKATSKGTPAMSHPPLLPRHHIMRKIMRTHRR